MRSLPMIAVAPKTAMILLLLVLVLILLVAGGLVVLFMARRAPQGCEDGTGFHLITTLSGEETLPDLGLDPAHENCGVGHVEAGGHDGIRADA